MRIQGTKGILEDGSIMYLIFLDSVIYHADPEASMDIIKKEKTLDVIVTPSESTFKESLISNIVFAHKLFGIKPIMSKSTALHKKIFFQIEL